MKTESRPLCALISAFTFATLLAGCPGGGGGTDAGPPATTSPPTTTAPPAAGPIINWTVGPTTDLTWDFKREKRFRNGAFTEKDALDVHLKGVSPGVADITFEGRTDRFKIAPDGTFSPDDLSIRLVPQYLVALAGPIGRAVAVGDTWTVKIPRDTALTALDDVVVIQQTLSFEVKRIDDIGGDTQVTLHVGGTQRLIDNPGLRSLIGPHGTASQDAEDALSRLGQDNWFLDGDATLSVARKAPIKAAFTVAIVPAARASAAEVASSPYRNNVTYTLR